MTNCRFKKSNSIPLRNWWTSVRCPTPQQRAHVHINASSDIDLQAFRSPQTLNLNLKRLGFGSSSDTWLCHSDRPTSLRLFPHLEKWGDNFCSSRLHPNHMSDACVKDDNYKGKGVFIWKGRGAFSPYLPKSKLRLCSVMEPQKGQLVWC